MDIIFLVKTTLTIALFLIMFVLGIGLTLNDFRRLGKQPKAAVSTIVLQLLILPLSAIAVIKMMDLSGSLAMGLLILAVCPGGATSNLFSKLGKGDVALSVGLTAFNSLFAFITIPFLLAFSTQFIFGSQTEMLIPFELIGQQLFLITLLPLVLGMFVRHKFSRWCIEREALLIQLVSAVFFMVIFMLWILQYEQIMNAVTLIGSASCLLLVMTTTITFFVCRGLKLSIQEEITSVLEVGIQNSAIAFFIAINLMNDPSLAAASAVYSVIMVFAGIGICWIYKRTNIANV